MAVYKCLSEQEYKLNEFSLSPINLDNLKKIRIWRNSQLDVLRQKEVISEEMQILYFNNQILPNYKESNPKQLLFGFYKNEILIGYGGLVHISWEDKRAEISFLLDSIFTIDSNEHDSLFGFYLQLIQRVGFENLKFNKLHTEVYSFRSHHIAILEKNNFMKEGILRQHILIDNIYHDSVLHSKLSKEFNNC